MLPAEGRYTRAWSARNRQPGQHKGPITRAFLNVLGALLWGFHNSRSGCCFPSYEAIAAKAERCRDTVYEALKALEWAGVLRRGAPARSVRPLVAPLDGHPHVQCLRVQGSAAAARWRFGS